jgi:trans-2,3-dihydro-3-hydroxyanthranilate isomerase
MPRRYVVLDVFTNRPLAGNPLAVVLDTDGLDDREMQSIAREFNLSETVFVLPARNPVHSASLRIFTPGRELPFAGHPTVGTAVLLGMRAAEANREKRELMLVLEEGIGPIRCGVTLEGRTGGRAVFDVPQPAAEAGTAKGNEAIAGALGLEPSEIGFENHHPVVFSAGLPFQFVPVRDLAVIDRAHPTGNWRAGFGDVPAYVYCRQTQEPGRQFHARMFAPEFGINEDPASGSAVVAFSGVVRRFDEPHPGRHRFLIEQGFEMGRPSLITLEIDIEDGVLAATRIAGDAVVVAEGMLEM